MNRREFLQLGLQAAAAAAAAGCAGGEPGQSVDHLLPSADHRRILLKASFRRSLDAAPVLSANGLKVPGRRSDSRGLFWSFDADGLRADTEHELVLETRQGRLFGEAWTLRTFPAPDTRPPRFRLLAYTCAGGPDPGLDPILRRCVIPIRARRRLLRRALSFSPDAVLANGDHVYWDLRSGARLATGGSPLARFRGGVLDRELPVLGTANEDVVRRAFGPQLAGLYGTLLRGTPAFFLQDDHDYTENDEASDELRTFPPDAFMLDVARATQRLYYPELIADGSLPASLRRDDGLAESFGTLRYGSLFEGLCFDCRRFLDAGEEGHFVPPEAEAWLIARLRGSDAAHVAAVPSTPVLWSAGKWGEWYPDFLDEEGVLGTRVPKPYWSRGWLAQHDRLLRAAASQPGRRPLFVQGDLHAIALGEIRATRDLSLDHNPALAVLTGPVSSNRLFFPSSARNQPAAVSAVLEAEEFVRPIEENGFTLLDFDEAGVRISLFRWKPDDGEAALDALEPFHVQDFPRPAVGATRLAALRATPPGS